jgi:polysaccharide biosynthesis protein PslH
MERMKVLLLTQVLPYPPDSGPKVKTWNLLKFLAERYEVTLVSFVRGDQDHETSELAKVCHAVHTVPMHRKVHIDALALLKSLITGKPWMMARDERTEMFSLVEHLSNQSDYTIVHADQLNMAQYALKVKNTARVLDAHNALWLLYRRLWQTLKFGPYKILLDRDWRLLKRYEGAVCRQFDGVLAVSEEDRSALLEAADKLVDIRVIPIAVDTDEILPISRKPNTSHLLHIGTMFWLPNVDGITWFVNEIFPLVRQKAPEVIFDVVGARPPKSILDMEKEGSGVVVTGYVADPGPYLENAAVMVVPLRAGGGMRVKIINALAQEMPIVSTTLGCEGISVENEKHLLVADTPQDFADAVIRLLRNHDLGRKLGAQGRKLIQMRYDYRAACQPIDELYNSIQYDS